MLLRGAEPLRSGAFRRYLAIATIISICLWTYQTSLTWTLLQQTGSAATVSLLQTLMTLPLPLAMIPAGLLIDRLGPRRMMFVGIAGYVVSVGVTGLLALSGVLPVEIALGFALWLGAFDALYVVAGPVYLGRSVPPEQMPAAIGLNLLNVGLGRILGGPLGGLLVGSFGPSAALLPAAGGLIGALLLVRTLPPVEGAGVAVRWLPSDLLAAFGFVRRTRAAATLIALGSVSALSIAAYVVLLPVIARDLLNVGSAQLGLLTASGGVGALCAAASIDALGRRLRRGRTVVLAICTAALLVIALGATRTLPLTALVVGLLAGAMGTFSATTNLLLQVLSPPSMRGRVVALYGFVYYGLQPIGLVGAGIAADRFGVAAVLTALPIAALIAIGVIVALDRGVLRLDVDPLPRADAAPRPNEAPAA